MHDAATLEVFSDAFRRAGFEVHGTRSAAQAINALEDAYDALVADHAIPEINGVDLVAALRFSVPDTPGILVADVVTGGLVAWAEKFKVAAVIEKAVAPDRLVESVAGAVGRDAAG